MPYGDGTGPNGFGPRTGRGLGFCNGYNTPGYLNPVGYGYRRGLGRGWGRGFGRGYGRGFGWGYYGAPYVAPTANYYNQDPKVERDILENEIKNLETTIDNLRKRLEEIGKDED
ncbi:MAG TPA: hypothetical protein ENJ25_02880 [Firmicutes bacterium]|jgi:hypothetical protein|uniref:DUF5320 domain-containing protein n=1 Tax=candidate division TA06 bacterium TaxID=2250710 RepID=A0A660S7R0_UNCT6|nr:MAG: hypothetical protein DRP44_07235 [candidate division TA06 bacterium]HFD05070.1 hypothetical protein [Bacillota bacterium]